MTHFQAGCDVAPASQPERCRRRAPVAPGSARRLGRRLGWGKTALLGVLLFSVPAAAHDLSWEEHQIKGHAAIERGQHAEAERSFRAALEQAEQFGSLDPRLADSVNSLAILYAMQKKYSQAEPLFQRALGVSMAALGPDHPDVAIVLRNIGILMTSQGRYEEADILLSRSLALANRVVGQEHPLTAVTMRTIALYHAAQGHFGEAERFIRRSLEISEKTLGSEHPEVATSLEVFARVLRTVHRDHEAHRAELRAREIRSKSARTD